MYKALRFVSLIGLSGVMTVSLSACGGGSDAGPTSSSSSSSGTSSTTGTNVAAASAGASITTNYASNESYVIDGDTSTTNYWQAGATNDWLKIDFGAAYNIESVDIAATGLSSSTDFTMEYSTDDAIYRPLATVAFCGASYSLDSSGYSCDFGITYKARYFRYTAKNVTTPQIHEITIMGK